MPGARVRTATRQRGAPVIRPGRAWAGQAQKSPGGRRGGPGSGGARTERAGDVPVVDSAPGGQEQLRHGGPLLRSGPGGPLVDEGDGRTPNPYPSNVINSLWFADRVVLRVQPECSVQFHWFPARPGSRDTAGEAWAEVDRMLAGMPADAIAATEQRFARMDPVGQARMTACTAARSATAPGHSRSPRTCGPGSAWCARVRPPRWSAATSSRRTAAGARRPGVRRVRAVRVPTPGGGLAGWARRSSRSWGPPRPERRRQLRVLPCRA